MMIDDETLEDLVEIAMWMSVTANTDEARTRATEKRREAYTAIDTELARIGRLRSILNLFPTPAGLHLHSLVDG